MDYNLTFKPFGERSILIEWQAVIEEKILLDIIHFKKKIKNSNIKQIIELRVTYHSLLVVYESRIIDFELSVKKLKCIYKQVENYSKPKITQWKIPVCYDTLFGMDLDTIAIEKQLTKEAIIQRHSEAIYTVYFIGFLPGFMYLGGLDEILVTPRKQTPRLKIGKGSVAIGGHQTGVYPFESPGGWNIIGNSPIEFFNLKNEVPCFAKSGDRIIFNPISFEKYRDIEKKVKLGIYQIEGELIHD